MVCAARRLVLVYDQWSSHMAVVLTFEACTCHGCFWNVGVCFWTSASAVAHCEQNKKKGKGSGRSAESSYSSS